MISFIAFLVLLEMGVLGVVSWLVWPVWFIVSYAPYFKRTKSLKTIILSFLFLVWVAIVSRLYRSNGGLNGLNPLRLKATSQVIIIWLAFLYFLSLKFLEKKPSVFKKVKLKINWLKLKPFYGLSIFFISSLFFFSGKLYYWWLNSLVAFFCLLFWHFIFAKKSYTRIQKIVISFLFLELFLVLQLFSYIPEIKAFVYSLVALFFI